MDQNPGSNTPQSSQPTPTPPPVPTPTPESAKAPVGSSATIPTAETKRLPLLWVIVIILLIVVLGLGGYLLFSRNANPVATTSQGGSVLLTTPASTTSAEPTETPLETSDNPDIQAVDKQLVDLDSAATLADTGLNDQQGDLTE